MKNQIKPEIFLCDFDGTITASNLADFLYLRFASCGSKYSDLWAENKIGTREEIEQSFQHITATKEEMEAALAEIPIDPCFNNFVEVCQRRESELAIVSDGLEWAIRHVLHVNGISEQPNIFANKILFTKSGFEFDFPYYHPVNPLAGVYKPVVLNLFKRQGYRVVLVGDGKTDMDAALVADFVFARDNLLAFCIEKNIPAHAYHDFCTIINFLENNDF